MRTYECTACKRTFESEAALWDHVRTEGLLY